MTAQDSKDTSAKEQAVLQILEGLVKINECYLEDRKSKGVPMYENPVFGMVRCLDWAKSREDKEDSTKRNALEADVFRDIAFIVETDQASPSDLAAWRCAELRHQGRLDARIVMRKRLVESTHPDGRPNGQSRFTVYEVGVQYGTEIEWFS